MVISFGQGNGEARLNPGADKPVFFLGWVWWRRVQSMDGTSLDLTAGGDGTTVTHCYCHACCRASM